MGVARFAPEPLVTLHSWDAAFVIVAVKATCEFVDVTGSALSIETVGVGTLIENPSNFHFVSPPSI